MSETPKRPGLTPLLDFFSSIWTGVALLAILFVYSAVGSAGAWLPAGPRIWRMDDWAQLMVRQWPGLEMTEYEWFHWWPFNVLIALICLTLVTATLRRIPLRPVNYGVWMIHGGIIVLALGSVVYFGTKVEGDAPVARRQVVAALPGHEPVSFIAAPGNTAEVGDYRLSVSSIDPQWEILSGADSGRRAYSVNVRVDSPQRTFIRQLLAGHPQYTEDLVRSTDGPQPWTRAKKALDRTLVDEDLDLSLDYAPQEWFYLSNNIVKSWALYLREVPPGSAADRKPQWVERPIEGLPLYNDYVGDLDAVWPAPETVPRPLRVEVPPAAPDDPLPQPVAVTAYLRYAFPEARRRAGGEVFDPAVRVALTTSDGRSRTYDLLALDASHRMEPQGRMVFEWADTEAALEDLLETTEPRLEIRVDDADVELDVPITATLRSDPELPFTPIEGTGYRYRVQALHDRLQLPGGDVISVAAVEIETPDRSFVRWVADDPARTRDLPADPDPAAGHGGALPPEPGISMAYTPGEGPAPITIVGGPGDDDLRLILALGGGGEPIVQRIAAGEALPLSSDVTLTVLRFAAYTRQETKPAVVPRAQRDRDAGTQLAMIRLELPGHDPLWLRYNHWPFRDAAGAFGRARFAPTQVDLADGRRLELLFSRRRQPLPAPAVLDDFVMDTHLGGFTGQNLSVLNWTSSVRFETPDGLTEPLAVSVNDPAEHGGLWYFQAQWDPPEPQRGYGGLNYTVLGVGNRRGVNIMLLGCCLSTLGMIYAFYVKPIIRRRRLAAAQAQAAAALPAGEAERPAPAPPAPVAVGAAEEERT